MSRPTHNGDTWAPNRYHESVQVQQAERERELALEMAAIYAAERDELKRQLAAALARAEEAERDRDEMVHQLVEWRDELRASATKDG